MHVGDSIEQGGNRHARLETTERCADTVMCAVTKADVRNAGARHVEAISMLKVPRVTVGRAEHDEHECAARDRATAHREVARGDTKHHLRRAWKAKHLLNGGRQQSRVFPDARILRRVVEEAEHRVGNEVGRCLRPGQQQHVRRHTRRRRHG